MNLNEPPWCAQQSDTLVAHFLPHSDTKHQGNSLDLITADTGGRLFMADGLLLVVRPGAPSSVLAPSSDAMNEGVETC